MLSLYNTLTRKKEEFNPADPKNVRMYVCGPTVYDRPHLGNARSVVVYDVLYRLLRHIYGENHVNYVRNITDVDDKINAAARANNEPISALTKRVEGWFHEDMAALNCLSPTHEPHATDHIKEMVAIIEKLIAGGHAYVSQGHVLFRVASYKEYGKLSGRKLEDLIAGARVEVESYKEHAGDFVLWKPADAEDDPSSVFDSPWGKGRPGWHIECSAMSSKYLGDNFDIHGGGADLMFPHHENEIAQSCCAAPKSSFAKTWVHNGFLTVNGEKMSKSLGNFTTVKDVLDKGVRGEVIRFALLSAHYRSPLDWNDKLLHDAKLTLDKWYRSIGGQWSVVSGQEEEFLVSLSDDLNIQKAISIMHEAQPNELLKMGNMLGFLQMSPEKWFKGDSGDDNLEIQNLINERITAKKSKNWARADEIRKTLADQGIMLEDKPDGTTDWRRE
ncbi:MAG: cysteine--tRNA ligase [Rickettsiales bacterium]